MSKDMNKKDAGKGVSKEAGKDAGKKSATPPLPQQGNDLQGEGNYDATRRFDKAERDFVQSGKVDEAARAAPPKTDAEADELERAEREGRSHSKGEDGAR
jgi:hypothetical protein